MSSAKHLFKKRKSAAVLLRQKAQRSLERENGDSDVRRKVPKHRCIPSPVNKAEATKKEATNKGSDPRDGEQSPQEMPPRTTSSPTTTKQSKRIRKNDPFPKKLFRILEETEKRGEEDIIAFLPHGKTFAVRDITRFVDEVMPRHFTTARYSSFLRQLNFYGFRRVSEPDGSFSYYHELFQKNQKIQCDCIKRKKHNESDEAVDIADILAQDMAEDSKAAPLKEENQEKEATALRSPIPDQADAALAKTKSDDHAELHRRNSNLQLGLTDAIEHAPLLNREHLEHLSRLELEEQVNQQLLQRLQLGAAAGAGAIPAALGAGSACLGISTLAPPQGSLEHLVRAAQAGIQPQTHPLALALTSSLQHDLSTAVAAREMIAAEQSSRMLRNLQLATLVEHERQATLSALVDAKQTIDLLLAASFPAAAALGGHEEMERVTSQAIGETAAPSTAATTSAATGAAAPTPDAVVSGGDVEPYPNDVQSNPTVFYRRPN